MSSWRQKKERIDGYDLGDDIFFFISLSIILSLMDSPFEQRKTPNPWETNPIPHPIRGHLNQKEPSFRGWLRSEYLKKNGKAPTKNAISDAVETIGGQAEFEGRLIKPCVRVGGFNDAVYLDRGRDGWESVRIDGSGSSLVQSGEVPFIRPGGMDALPIPAEQGDLRDLLRFKNVKDESDFILITAWLIGAMMPEGPYPILALHGEQGSSKSTSAKILKSIIDPSTASFGSTPRSE